MEPHKTTVDITPVGCQTPEGCARVNAAADELANANSEAANVLRQLLDDLRRNEAAYHRLDEETRDSIDAAEVACKRRAAATEEFLRAIAGAPKVGS